MDIRRHLTFDIVDLKDSLVPVLFFVLPFFHRFVNIAIGLMVVAVIVECIQKKKIPTIKVSWLLPGLFLYYVISELLSGGSWSVLEKRFVLLLPFLFVFYPTDVKSLRRVYIAFVAGNLVAVVFCLARAVDRSLTYHNGQWIFDAKVLKDTDYDFLTSSVMGGNYFFSSEFSFFLHPIYFGMYILFAQYLLFEISKEGKWRCWLILLYVIFLIALFLLSSKAALIGSILVTAYILFASPISRKVKIGAMVASAIVAIIFVTFNPRLRVFRETIETQQLIDPSAHYGHALRILSWDAALSVIKENWMWGVGEARKESELVSAYHQRGYVFPAQERFNTHNQYLDFLLGGGIICLGLFLAVIVCLAKRALSTNNHLLGIFLVIFLFIALFENVMSRYPGIVFFSLFLSILAPQKELSTNKT